MKLFFFGDEKGELIDVARDYLKRTDRRYRPELVALKPARRKKVDVRDEEGARILERSAGHYRVVLDEGGKSYTSVELSRAIERWLALGRPIAFLIGGATGHATAVKDAAEQTLSLSSLTLPHKMAVLVMAEQIYRAGEIARGGPYHKAP